jgi:hypothetical protein
MPQWRVVIVTVLGCALVAGTAAAASDEAEAPDPVARQEEAVALVLDQDPRFADALDYEVQRIKGSQNFDTLGEVLGTSNYRLLPTQNVWYSPVMDFGDGGSVVVEIILVEGCEVPEDESELLTPDLSRYEDPCAWRHSWVYRVEPDDTVTLLYDEGDPDPMAFE